MIPNVGGAAFAGLLWLLINGALAAGLLLWWAWRCKHALGGVPLAPLPIWQWVLAVLLSVMPIATAVGLVQMWLSDRYTQQVRHDQDVWSFQTLKQPMNWGEVVLPAGSHIERELPPPWLVVDTSIPPELPDGKPDLRYLSAVRFAQPQQVGAIWVSALGVREQLVLELARPHRFAAHGDTPAEDCPAGYMALFNLGKPLLEGVHLSAQPNGLVMADWVFDTCFQSEVAIMLRYWKDGELVWAKAPDYGV